jgi:hypothetical protein
LEEVRDPVRIFGRCGVVYVSWTRGWQSRSPDVPSDPDVYSCGWQNNEPGDGDDFQSDEFASLDDAVRWARHRSDRVLVRPQWDPNTYYLATDEPPERWRPLRSRPNKVGS